jgi:hypothetical protein
MQQRRACQIAVEAISKQIRGPFSRPHFVLAVWYRVTQSEIALKQERAALEEQVAVCEGREDEMCNTIVRVVRQREQLRQKRSGFEAFTVCYREAQGARVEADREKLTAIEVAKPLR